MSSRHHTKRPAPRPAVIALTLLLTLAGAASAGEKVKFGHLSIADGLPESGITTLLQDRLGFLWLGTANGLVRYDGYEFTTYKPDPDDPHSLGGRIVLALTEDRNGVLWVGTRRGGLNRYDRDRDRFVHYRHDPNDPTSLSHDAVGVIFEDGRGRLWIGTGDMEAGTGGGLNRLERESGTFRRWHANPDDPASLGSNVITGMREDDRGRLWIGTRGGGLNRLDPDGERITRFRHDPSNPDSLGSDDISDLAVDDEGTLWLATANGLDRMLEGGRFRHYRADPARRGALSSDKLSTVFVDRDGNLWVGTWDGVVHRLAGDGESFYRFRNDPQDPDSLSEATAITDFYQDRAEILWIATWGGGLNKLDKYSAKFPHFRHEPNNPNSLSHDQVSCFWEDRAGNLWIGTRGGGLNRFNPRSETYTHFLHDPQDPGSLASDFVFAVVEDRAGTLWVGTAAGLDRFNPDGGSFSTYPLAGSGESARRVRTLAEDRAGNLWIGTAEGLTRLDPATGRTTDFRHDERNPGSLSDDYVRVIYEDRRGDLWVGTESGLNRFDPATGRFDVFFEAVTGLDIIEALHEDAGGRFWVGTFNGGLHLLDRDGGSHRALSQRDGLAHDTVYDIVESDSGELWLSTGNGLSRFDPRTESFRNYGIADGLQGHRFDGGAIKTGFGELLFGGPDGINAFYPRQVRDNPYPPQVVLTELMVQNERLAPGTPASPLERHISLTSSVTLPHHRNVLSFAFAALHYADPARNVYRHRLEPVDEEWLESGNTRRATYTNLKPGKYVFQVRAANGDGVWSEAGTSLELVITPPWWRTPWAHSGYVLLIACGIFAADRFQRGRLVARERARALEQEARLRTEAAELHAKAAEAQARALQAENERQTRELENARNLQLSLLPERLPEHPDLEIAAHMKTASEVGGDYYDFEVGDDGTLTVAIGDATGHGIRAGTMVTATKVLFKMLAGESDGVRVLHEATRVLKRLELDNLFMALALVKVRRDHLVVAGAGMPPTLVLRGATGEVEEIHLEGAPLGSFADFPYRSAECRLARGDSVVLMSDGLPEMLDPDGECLGYERVRQALREAAGAAPEAIVEQLAETAEAWAKGRPRADDVTLVVLRVR